MAEFGNMVGVSVPTITSMLARDSATTETLAKYSAKMNVPIWEMVYAPEYSAYGHELPEWSDEAAINTIVRWTGLVDDTGMSQRQFALAAGISPSSLNQIVSRKNTSLSVLIKVSNALKIPMYKFFISEQEYRDEMDRRKGEIEQNADNNETPIAISNEEAEGVELALPFDDETNGDGETAVTLADGVYRYGNLTIVLKEGRVSFGA